MFPRVYCEYVRFCRDYRNRGLSPLGECQLVWMDETRTRIVCNLFGQEYYGTNRRQTDYAQLRHALQKLAQNRFVRGNRMTLGFPDHIGCALAGGDWSVVLQIIREIFEDYPGAVQIWKL